jgi:hypothetical protein
MVQPNECMWKAAQHTSHPPTMLGGKVQLSIRQESNDTEPLLHASLRRGSLLSKQDLAKLCAAVKPTPKIMPGDKGLTLRAFATALINKAFQGEHVENRKAIIDSVLNGRSMPHSGNPDLTSKAIEALGDHSTQHYKTLKLELKAEIAAQSGDHSGVRARAKHNGPRGWTPEFLKKLKPDGSMLTW